MAKAKGYPKPHLHALSTCSSVTLRKVQLPIASFFCLLNIGRVVDALSGLPRQKVGGISWEDNPDFPSDSRLGYADDGSKLISENKDLTRNPYSPDFAEDMLLVVPGQKLAFCYIPKVACTQFNMLLNSMNNITSGKVWYRSSASTLGLDPKQITRANGWFKGVFLREPTERLLSAHRSKCERSKDGHLEDEGSQCLGDIVDETASLKTRQGNFKHSLSMLKSYDGDNPHYVPMRSFCGGLSPTLKEYDYVGRLEGGYANVQGQVREMLMQAGINNTALVEKLFPTEAPKTNHVTRADSTFNEYYDYTKDTLEAMQYYAKDYTLPGISGKSHLKA